MKPETIQKLKQGLISPQALIGWVILLIKPVWKLVELAGDVDFLIQHAGDIERAFQSGWTTLGFAFVGLFLVGHAAYKAPGAATKTSPVPAPVIVNFEEPDYEAWDGSQELTLLEAAFLWAEENPQPGAMFLQGASMARWKMLTEAVRNKDLPAYLRLRSGRARPTTDPDIGHIVYRKDLVEFAEKRKLRPKFLYPEEREWRV